MHTPTPWITKEIGKNLYVEAQEGGFVCDMQISDALGEINGPQTRADAALIVKAVNSYQAMKEALEMVQRTKDWAIANNKRTIAECCDWSIVEKALALAEGAYHDSA